MDRRYGLLTVLLSVIIIGLGAILGRYETTLPFQSSAEELVARHGNALNRLVSVVTKDKEFISMGPGYADGRTDYRTINGHWQKLTSRVAKQYLALLKNAGVTNIQKGYRGTSITLGYQVKMGNLFSVYLVYRTDEKWMDSECEGQFRTDIAGRCRVRLAGPWDLQYEWSDTRIDTYGANALLPLSIDSFKKGVAWFSSPFTLQQLEKKATDEWVQKHPDSYPALPSGRTDENWLIFKKRMIRSGDVLYQFEANGPVSGVASMFGAAGIAVVRDKMVVAVFQTGVY